jgi:hypothetical protein
MEGPHRSRADADPGTVTPPTPLPHNEGPAGQESRAELRKVPVELLAPMGWLSGMLHVPVHQTLAEFLRLSPRLLKLTRVRVPQEPDPRPFVAFRRDLIAVVAPSFGEEVEKPGDVGYTASRSVACLLPHGVVRGSLAVLLNMRLSDHLQQQGPLFTLRHCLLTPYGATAKSPEARAFPTLIVNLDAVLGISEET